MSDNRSTPKTTNTSITCSTSPTATDNAVGKQIPVKTDKKSTTQITTTTTTTKKIQKLTTRTVSSSSLSSSNTSPQPPTSSSNTSQSPFVAILVEENKSKATTTKSSSRVENNETTFCNGIDDSEPQKSTKISSQSSLLSAEETSCHQSVRRKQSLMPMITENELISSSDLGTRDPVAVAHVFGDEFASQFCTAFETLPSPFTPPSLLYESAKHSPSASSNNLRRLSVEAVRFQSPRDFPTIKVQEGSSSSSDDESKNEKLHELANKKYSWPSKGQVSESVQKQLHYFDYSTTNDTNLNTGCAKDNPEFLRFQKSFIKWINKQTRCFGSAFVLKSENNLAICRIVEDEQLFADGFYCCGHDALTKALGLRQSVNLGTTSSECSSEACEIEGPIVIDIQELDKNISSDLYYLAELIYKHASDSKVPDRSEISASLCGIRSTCSFITTLIIVHQQKETRQRELDNLLPHMELIGSLTSSISNLEEQRKASHLSQMIIDKTQRVLLNMQDMNLLVRNITKEAKALVSAEICSLFLLDRENKELVAEVFEKNSSTDEYLSEIRMPLSKGIIGYVARTGEITNIADVYNHPDFFPDVDQKTGFVTRNILCFPIKDNSGQLVGVAELCNKIGKPAFTKHDEQVAQTFAVYCAISISHCLLYRKLQESHRRSHMAAELLVQGSTLSIAPEDILRLTVREIPSPVSFHPDFNEFRFFPRSIGTGGFYVEATLSMFQELGFIDRFRIRRRTLARFLLMVQKGYREVPYHNWGHAFSVAHFCYLLLRLPAVKNALDELERLSLLVACLCHDIDHRGTTNTFQLQTKTPLAQLYSSEGSVLERHHFAQTVTILGMDECNIFDALTRHEYQSVLDNMREIILATDLVAHLRKVERIQRMVSIGFNKNSSEHHYLFMCLLMTASDLSDQSKHFKYNKLIAENIYKEFFSQGDLERQMGNEPSPMMDRERACVPKIQLEFTDSVALKVFNCISKILPELSITHETLQFNRACWQALDDIILEEDVPTTNGLDYLRNETIENKVYKRVEKQGKFNPQLVNTEKTPSISSGDEKSK